MGFLTECQRLTGTRFCTDICLPAPLTRGRAWPPALQPRAGAGAGRCGCGHPRSLRPGPGSRGRHAGPAHAADCGLLPREQAGLSACGLLPERFVTAVKSALTSDGPRQNPAPQQSASRPGCPVALLSASAEGGRSHLIAGVVSRKGSDVCKQHIFRPASNLLINPRQRYMFS